MRLHDVGALAAQKTGQLDQRGEIAPGRHLPIQAGDEIRAKTRASRLRHQDAFPARDEHRLEPRGIEVCHRVQRVLLRPAELELGDDVTPVSYTHLTLPT